MAIIISHCIHNIASIHTAELMAIFACLSHISYLHPNSNFLRLTDSLTSFYSLTDPLAQRIHFTLLTLNSINSKITFVWITGHIRLPEHDAADLAVKQALLFLQVTDNTPALVSDYKNSGKSNNPTNFFPLNKRPHLGDPHSEKREERKLSSHD